MEIDRTREHRFEEPPEIHPPTPEEGMSHNVVRRLLGALNKTRRRLHKKMYVHAACAVQTLHQEITCR